MDERDEEVLRYVNLWQDGVICYAEMVLNLINLLTPGERKDWGVPLWPL